MLNTKYLVLLPLFGLLFWTKVFSAQPTVIGIWKTESSQHGYLHVSIEPCENFLCGTIESAYDLNDNIANDYEYLGEKVVWDMKETSASKWKNGKIWDPSQDKTYKSKMSLKNGALNVSGCILFFCRSQTWSRVR